MSGLGVILSMIGHSGMPDHTWPVIYAKDYFTRPGVALIATLRVVLILLSK